MIVPFRRAERIVTLFAIGLGLAIAGACGPPGTRDSLAAPARGPSGSTALAAAVGDLVAAFPGRAGVVVAFPGVAEPIYAADADTPFIAASLYKLAVLLRVESLVESHALAYDDTITIENADVTVDGSNEPAGTVLTIDAALEEMITYSDNGSALAFLRMYGAPATNARLAAAGIAGFHVAEDPREDHRVTARALATFFDLLATHRLVSAAASDRMLARLERQTINDRLPRDLPPRSAVAHKTGDLIGSVHDAGVLQSAGGPRIAVVLTSGGTEAGAKDLIARIGTAVYAARLSKPAGAPAGALPSAQAAPSPLGSGLAIALGIGTMIGVALLVAVRRTPRRRARRRSGPMTVWSPPRERSTRPRR